MQTKKKKKAKTKLCPRKNREDKQGKSEKGNNKAQQPALLLAAMKVIPEAQYLVEVYQAHICSTAGMVL